MKKNAIRTLAAVAFGLSMALPAAAAEQQHGGMQMEHGGMKMDKASSGDRKGQKVREATVEGYKFEYHLIDLAQKMKDKPMQGHGMSQMKSHHLMVYVQGPDGKAVESAKVGYMVTGPDNAEQKAMAMAMEGGYGADVDLKSKGDYKVKTKAVVGDKTLTDDFTYTAK